MDNKKISLDEKTLKFLYNRYKNFAIPIIVISVCLVVTFQFLFPQIQNLFMLREEAKKATEEIAILKNNHRFLNSLDDATLDSYLRLTNSAVPTGKDFIGIINAISYASAFSGAEVKDFALEIGDLDDTIQKSTTLSSISVNLFIDGGIEVVNRFVETLSTTFPLSEATNIAIGNTSSNVTISFYYKHLPPIRQDISTPVVPISNEKLTLINNLSKFNYSD